MLPGDVEIDLYRLADGEPIRWSGMSSGEVERLQGVATMAAAAMMILASAPGAWSAWIALRDPAGAAPGPATGFAFFGLAAAAAAAGVFLRGWSLYRSAGRVAWSVTTTRLIRLVAGDADRAQSWTKEDIRKVERRGAGRFARIVVSVRRPGSRKRTLIIAGAADLEMAEHALSGLAPAGAVGKSS